MAELEGGYILLSRKLVESEIWDKPPLYLKVWIYILTKAQHKPYKNFDRGELLISIPELIDACSYKVGYRIEKPTKSQIFNILEWLRNSNEGANEDDTKDTMINTTKTTRGMVVKVCNYNVYQDPKKYEHNSEDNNEDSTKTTMPKRQADTINKNVKNVKNDKNKERPSNEDSIESDFEKLWKLYPNKKGKPDALRHYKNHLKKGTTNKEIQDGIVKYSNYIKESKIEKKYQKHGSTFFSQQSWNDDYENEDVNKIDFNISDKSNALDEFAKKMEAGTNGL